MNLTAVVAAQIEARFPPCPLCSFYRAEHSELPRDVIVRPNPIKNRRTGRWLLTDLCPHAKQFFGPHENEADASTLWKAEVEKLREEKQRRRQQIARETRPTNPTRGGAEPYD